MRSQSFDRQFRKLALMRVSISVTLTILAIAFTSVSAVAQTVPQFTVERPAIVSGGGTASSPDFVVQISFGLPNAGRITNPDTTSIFVGNWYPELAPTAALVSIGGKVMMADGRGVGGVRLSLLEMNGTTRSALTSQMGYYRFDGLEAGRDYILSVSSRQYDFVRSSIFVQSADEITDLDIIATPLQ